MLYANILLPAPLEECAPKAPSHKPQSPVLQSGAQPLSEFDQKDFRKPRRNPAHHATGYRCQPTFGSLTVANRMMPDGRVR